MKVKFYVTLCACVIAFFLAHRASAQMKQVTIDQIKLLLQEKESRTPAQRKIASQLLQASREQRGEKMVAGVNLERANVNATLAGMVKIDMDADVTPALLSKITSLGGQIIFPSKEYHSIRALVPLSKVETIAGYKEVKFVQPAVLSRTVGIPEAGLKKGLTGKSFTKKDIASVVIKKRQSLPERIAKVKKQVEKYLMVLGAGSANSQGDHSHRADDARNAFGYAGQGIKIGVLSDSYNYLGGAAADVLTDDLPGIGNPFGNTTPVTVLQDHSASTDEDEGRAMLQIVHDLAPKAQLFFATGNASEAGFATNIKALRDAGCDIVIDDLGYYDEPVFQDGIVAKAVQYVVGNGGMYFSSAGNEGALALGTSGVWEGDFTDVGSPAFTLGSKTGTIHNFGSTPANGDSIKVPNTTSSTSSNIYNLQWADPYGASTNDYDLFLIGAAGTVKQSSTTTQNGTQNPYEQIAQTGSNFAAGDRLVVFKAASAAVRAISLNTNRGTLKVATSGQTHGHSAIPDAYCVAAIPATGVPFISTNTVESFTSDGPRRMFYDTLNNPYVAGSKFTFADNKYITRLKPDITAADGVSTTLPASTGLNPFYGTSAAAPHAGAIAALIKCARPTLTPAQIRTLLINNALDIQTPGYDNVSGYGVLQAYQSMVALNPTPAPFIALGTNTITEGSSSNGNGQIDPGEIGNLAIQLLNSTSATATNVTATVTTTTSGVTITKGTYNYGTINGNSSASNTVSPFMFAVNQSVACGTTITFQVLVTFGGGGPSPVGFTITTTLGTNNFASISAAIGTPAASNSVFSSSTGQQNGRISRGGTTSTCAAPVANPGLVLATGARQYDAYTFTNTTSASQCFTTTLNSTNGANLFTVAYTPTGFVPSNPSTNYLAEPGQSAVTQTYSFTVAAGAKFTVVVHAVDSLSNPGGNEVGSTYTLGITYVACTPKTTCTPISITTSTIATGTKGTYYVQHFAATGGSGFYIDSLTGNLPAGLSFAGDSLFGTPTQAGTFAITVKATDPTGCPSGSATYNLVISGIAPASVTATAGTPQTALPSMAFATALQATVKDASNNLLPGVNVMFSAPTTGASGTFAGGVSLVTVVTNASGVATAPTFTSNSTAGSYVVTAAVNGVTPSATFSLSNVCPTTVVTSSADDGPGSLRYIIANSCPNPVITFDPSVTQIKLTTGEIAINKSVTITGPGANLLSISGSNLSRIFNITAGPAIIAGLTIRDGKPQAGALTTNSQNGGGGILLYSGALTLTNCVITNNDASLTGYAEGGGLDNEGTSIVTITGCTFNNNTAIEDGGGIAHWGTARMTIVSSTIANNIANGDIVGDADGWGGGIFMYSNMTLTNCTVFGNTGYYYGGNIFRYSGTLTMGNTVVGGGTLLDPAAVASSGVDILTGTITSNGYNLVEKTGGYTLTSTNNMQGVKPKLLPLANYGGPTPTMLPISSSTVVNAGNPALLATATDQRGFTRVVGGRADIGAVETNYAATIAAGTPQSTLINSAFATPLQAKVTESGNNIAGDSLLFGAPATGASGTFAGGLKTVTVVTNASGIATAPTFTANGIVGTYTDTASIGAQFTSLKYVLTNTFIPVAFTGCPNVNLVIARPGYNIYNGEGVMMYNMDTTNGATTMLPGGPLKDSLTGRNIDINGASVNGQDGFVYAIRDTLNAAGTAAAPLFYRIGSNYANTMLGMLTASPLLAGENLSVVIPSAGSFDDQGNYYYVAMSGAYSFTTNAFTPSNYYIGKLAGVAALANSTTMLTPTWTKVDLTNAPAAFKTSVYNTITSSSGAGAGSAFQDIAYSNLYKSLYIYSSYASGQTYTGQLYAINPTTGAATFYANPPIFGATNNQVAGISTTASGNLRVFMTSGDIYKPIMAQNGIEFTSTLVKIGTSSVTPLGATGSIRGDLASCGVGPTTLPTTRGIVVSLPQGIIAYPNPARGLTTIVVSQPLVNATVHLMGIAGNIISEKSGVSGTTFQMDMTGKPGGMYMIEVIQGGNIQKLKIVKE